MIYQPVEEMRRRVEHRSVKDPMSGCWIWNGCCNDKGYGVMGDGRPAKNAKAHRVSYAAFIGDPGKSEVAHRCDNRSCVNPHHLFLATHQENMADCAKKARTHRGDRNVRAKLTEDDIPDIRLMLSFGLTLARIGKEYGVAAKTISMIRDGLNWGWVK